MAIIYQYKLFHKDEFVYASLSLLKGFHHSNQILVGPMGADIIVSDVYYLYEEEHPKQAIYHPFIGYNFS